MPGSGLRVPDLDAGFRFRHPVPVPISDSGLLGSDPAIRSSIAPGPSSSFSCESGARSAPAAPRGERTEIFRGSLPHFIAHIVIIAILVAWPEIILWLPRKMMAG